LQDWLQGQGQMMTAMGRRGATGQEVGQRPGKRQAGLIAGLVAGSAAGLIDGLITGPSAPANAT